MHGLRVAATGLLIGMAVALVAERWIQPLLFEVPARDPAVLTAVVTALLMAALLATALPALRASRADPSRA